MLHVVCTIFLSYVCSYRITPYGCSLLCYALFRSARNNNTRLSEREDPILIDADEEEDSMPQPGRGVAIPPSDICDHGNTAYNGVRYVFTINNPPTNSPFWGAVSNFGIWLFTTLNLRYVIWSLEKGACGTPHIQGYLELTTKRKATAMSNTFRGNKYKGYVAPAKGTAQQSVHYISHTGPKWSTKQGLLLGPWSKGEVVLERQRTDIQALTRDMKAGKSLKQLCLDHTEVMLKCFGNAAKVLNMINTKKRTWQTELHVYYGNQDNKSKTSCSKVLLNVFCVCYFL